MARPSIPGEIKAYIIQRLACFDTPTQVAKAVKEDFGRDLSRQVVEQHDPTKVAGKDMAQKWIDLFNSARKKFLDDTSGIAISHKPVRLRALQRMSETAESRGNLVLAANLLEQAAKEVGDVFTNRVKGELTGPNDQPLLPAVITIERRDARIAK